MTLSNYSKSNFCLFLEKKDKYIFICFSKFCFKKYNYNFLFFDRKKLVLMKGDAVTIFFRVLVFICYAYGIGVRGIRFLGGYVICVLIIWRDARWWWKFVTWVVRNCRLRGWQISSGNDIALSYRFGDNWRHNVVAHMMCFHVWYFFTMLVVVLFTKRDFFVDIS